MSEGKYAVAQAAELLALSAQSQGELGRRLLAEFLRNPFLDDDLLGLALRAGASRTATEKVLAGLCQDRMLKKAGLQRYRLDLETHGVEPLAPQARDAQDSGLVDELAIESGRLDHQPAFGLILMRIDGQPELVDHQAATWLGVLPEELNAAAFAERTGIHPGNTLGKAPSVTLVLTRPRPLRVAIYPCGLGDEPGLLIVMQEAALDVNAFCPLKEREREQVPWSEDLGARLQQEIVEPMLRIRHFLQNPNAEELSLARAALDQVDRFLVLLLPPGQNSGAQ